MPFLKNTNEEVSSNNRYEVATVMDAVPKLSYVVSHYGSHCLHANVQFSAIEKIMQSSKTDPSIIYMVPHHQQKVLQMRYQEVQVDYYGKIGMLLLGFMGIRWKVDGYVSGFEYSFVDYVIKGYYGQDHAQVESVIKLAVDTVQDRHPAAKYVIIQSDNASCFCSDKLHLQYYLEMLWSEMGYFGLLGNTIILFIILLYLIEG